MTDNYGWCQSCGALVFNSPQCHKCDGEVKPFCVDMQLVKFKERIKELEGLLDEIEAVSCGEKQIEADGDYDDSDGLLWIYKRIQALKG